MNLAMTNEAGAVYNTYLNSFKNEDSSVNWLPVCADAHGFVAVSYTHLDVYKRQPFSEFIDIIGDNQKIAVFHKSIPQLIMQIISCAEGCYESHEDKSCLLYTSRCV